MKYLKNMPQVWKAWFFGFKNTIVMAFILSVYTRLVNGAPQQHNNHHHQGCGQEELIRCANRLQMLSDGKEFTFVASKAELDKVCPDLHKGLMCIHSYTLRCFNLEQRNHFHELYRGTANVIKEVCKEGSYQDEFLRHLPCMRTVVLEYEMCTARYQSALEALNKPVAEQNQTFVNQNETIKSLCCSFQEYLNCATNTMRQSCGNDAADFTQNFLERMSSNLVRLHCQDYGDEECGVASGVKQTTTSIFNRFLLTVVAIGVTLQQWQFTSALFS